MVEEFVNSLLKILNFKGYFNKDVHIWEGRGDEGEVPPMMKLHVVGVGKM